MLLVNGKILSSNTLASKTTTEDKVNQLSKWVTGEFSPEEAHALTFEGCIWQNLYCTILNMLKRIGKQN